ncbi:hypothetical protein GWI33_006791 [Rhynchophorus ferrugineus]|uniref:Uncharacterized protein n=1 Tax=Rhynchophorus ferrugineus TaxID=354439 RepID=A0A834IU00_RHYFE|nr:hypothetical protein GWI33_006791 [Rhynchophorus ferrugineus]
MLIKSLNRLDNCFGPPGTIKLFFTGPVVQIPDINNMWPFNFDISRRLSHSHKFLIGYGGWERRGMDGYSLADWQRSIQARGRNNGQRGSGIV